MRYYGRWPGNEKGYRQQAGRCIAEVMDQKSFIGHQCTRPMAGGKAVGFDAAHGNGLYCMQHSEMLVAGKSFHVPVDEPGPAAEPKKVLVSPSPKHTAEPWALDSDIGALFGPDGKPIMTAGAHVGGEGWANAKLLVKAPNLLCALKNILAADAATMRPDPECPVQLLDKRSATVLAAEALIKQIET